jgi:hypothetical protein
LSGRLAAAGVAFALFTAAPVFAVEPTAGTRNAVQALAFDFARHPRAEAPDLYKFLHQALFGPEHVIADSEEASRSLERELAAVGPPSYDEPWCDTLGGQPILVRVNLRPFAANGFDAAALLDAFVETADEVHGDPQQLGVALDLVVDWLSSEDRKDLADSLRKLSRSLAKDDFPAVHHSEAYQRAYKPAYRIVEASLAANQNWCGGL